MFAKCVAAGVMLLPLAAMSCVAQETSASSKRTAGGEPRENDAQLLKNTEAFARKLFAWGPDVQVKLGALAPSPAADFYDVPIEITLAGHTESGDVYVSKDGKTLLRGEIYDMSADPFAANRAKIRVDGSPAKGPANARVTVVEFADFECPHCQQLYEALKAVEQRYPQIRIVYKDFPLNQIHPWAETAAIGGRCAYEQSPEAFWKVHDAIFANQELISAENVWDKLIEFATKAGLNAESFKSCLSSTEAQKAVAESHAEGVALGIVSTPTVYVNGRPLVGGDTQTLEQYINYELATQPK